MNKIHDLEDLEKLEEYLLTFEEKEIRDQLFTDFKIYSNYKNGEEWNKAVRICECLTIIGWGNYEPVQAVRGKFFNGNPETRFYNKFSKQRFVNAIWSKRKDGYTMEQGRTSYHNSPDIPNKKTVLNDHPVKEDIQDTKLNTQRNWIPINPILINRTISNCYENSKPLIQSIEQDLMSSLNHQMRPALYGTAIQRIRINCRFSYYDAAYNKTNYIIAPKPLKLKSSALRQELLKTHSKEEISKNGYFLRNRFEFGNFQSKTGTLSVQIHFEKEFSQLSHQEQKNTFSKHLTTALTMVIEKLNKKKLDYDFELMFADFEEILANWNK